MSDRTQGTDDEDEPSVETRIEALAVRLDWIDDDRLGGRHLLWVFITEQLLAVSGALVLGFLVLGASGIIPWDTVLGSLDTFLSLIVGGLAVLTFMERVVWTIGEWRDRSRENRWLIETGFEDDS